MAWPLLLLGQHPVRNQSCQDCATQMLWIPHLRLSSFLLTLKHCNGVVQRTLYTLSSSSTSMLLLSHQKHREGNINCAVCNYLASAYKSQSNRCIGVTRSPRYRVSTPPEPPLWGMTISLFDAHKWLQSGQTAFDNRAGRTSSWMVTRANQSLPTFGIPLLDSGAHGDSV